MPFLATPAAPVVLMVVGVEAVQQAATCAAFESDSVGYPIRELKVAGVSYPMRSEVRANFLPGRGEVVVDGFSPLFAGRGDTREEAQQDWAEGVHAAFQALLHKRPFEMTDEDRRKWAVLSDRIDVTVYRNRTPLQIRQFGRISKARPYPSQIQWESGIREPVSLDQVSNPRFVTFRPGQPIEAVVARDPVTFRLLRIVHVEPIRETRRLPREDEAQLLESIGSSHRLQDVEWD